VIEWIRIERRAFDSLRDDDNHHVLDPTLVDESPLSQTEMNPIHHATTHISDQ
jgi:hypothetical protein